MSELRFFFWNLQDRNEKTIGPAFKQLLSQNEVDILLLGETKVADAFIKKYSDLKLVHKVAKYIPGRKRPKYLKIYATQKNFTLTASGGGTNGELLSCVLEINNNNYMVFGAHLPSRVSANNSDLRRTNAKKCRTLIEEEEQLQARLLGKKVVGSIVFGDFNMNPFEKGFSDQEALFAIDLIVAPQRKLKDVDYFINPMFSLMGHYNYTSKNKSMPPGTYYYSGKNMGDPNDFFWNTIDGMIFRPSLKREYHDGEKIEIVDSIGPYPLFDHSKMKIDSKNYSDHLPIKFSFKF
ncbi:endonuclease/exonuclease/phosphatase family protein [Rufibacter immobilis]|uniref:endonuclease/exonuclease/phosphatase family protein n=1 Tax=Rufibacter immobilis TaxID=1348778 RepID=UPI0035EF1A45